MARDVNSFLCLLSEEWAMGAQGGQGGGCTTVQARMTMDGQGGDSEGGGGGQIYQGPVSKFSSLREHPM